MGDECESSDTVSGDPTEAAPLEGDVGGCALGAGPSRGGAPLLLAIAALLGARATRRRPRR
ncbi:MAG: hypothetical protein HYV09_01160 [Deltaproteobacteria bacterium]|nr:hypothetical protein [Deltaproteobacteria bacterium]